MCNYVAGYKFLRCSHESDARFLNSCEEYKADFRQWLAEGSIPYSRPLKCNPPAPVPSNNYCNQCRNQRINREPLEELKDAGNNRYGPGGNLWHSRGPG